MQCGKNLKSGGSKILNYDIGQLYIAIFIIGIATFSIRAVFLFNVPKITNHPIIRRGMDAVPASMLIALVIPFTFFRNNRLSLFSPDVFAIIISVAIIYVTKKYSYGLIIAIICYLIFNWLLF